MADRYVLLLAALMVAAVLAAAYVIGKTGAGRGQCLSSHNEVSVDMTTVWFNGQPMVMPQHNVTTVCDKWEFSHGRRASE